jgi:hypothetical protein
MKGWYSSLIVIMLIWIYYLYVYLVIGYLIWQSTRRVTKFFFVWTSAMPINGLYTRNWTETNPITYNLFIGCMSSVRSSLSRGGGINARRESARKVECNRPSSIAYTHKAVHTIAPPCNINRFNTHTQHSSSTLHHHHHRGSLYMRCIKEARGNI